METNKTFIWNLYHVVVSNHSDIICVCAPSYISAIKKVNNLINSWETKDSHSILSISFISSCLN